MVNITGDINIGIRIINLIGVYEYIATPITNPESDQYRFLEVLYAKDSNQIKMHNNKGSNAGRVASFPSMIGHMVKEQIIAAIKLDLILVSDLEAKKTPTTVRILAIADGHLIAAGVLPSTLIAMDIR